MRKLFQIAIVIVSVTISAILFTSCQNEPTSVELEGTSFQTGLYKFELPPGATFVSAKFYVYLLEETNQNIDVHRITNSWEECSTSWASFGGAYASDIEGTFVATTYGNGNDWTSVDVSSLVGSWLDGTYPNYGLLLDQKDKTWPRTVYRTNKYNYGLWAPYLEIFYTFNGVDVESDTTRAIGDTYIYESNPDQINCTNGVMYTGWGSATDKEKQALVQFELEYNPPPPPPQIECETAYAFGGNAATCFISLPNVNSNNWGWTNYIGEGSYDWPIYAGAGQCDISKGTLVGNLSVEYFGGTVTITYEIDPEFELGDTHVWVGTTPLPIKKGEYTTAPGQFNHNGENPVVVSGLSGNIYIAAHSGVCWEVFQ